MPVIVLETVHLTRGDEPDIGFPAWAEPTRSSHLWGLAEAMRC